MDSTQSRNEAFAAVSGLCDVSANFDLSVVKTPWSIRSVARYLRRLLCRGDPGKRGLAFLHNHRDGIVAFDFFALPMVTFQLLSCFFVIERLCGWARNSNL